MVNEKSNISFDHFRNILFEKPMLMFYDQNRKTQVNVCIST